MGQNNTWNPAQLNQRINELEAKVKAADVEANPEGEAETLLTKIGIDGTNYNVPHIISDITDADAEHIEYSTGVTVKSAIDTKAVIKTKTLSFAFNAQGYVTLHDRQDIDDADKVLFIRVKNTPVAYLISIYTYSLGRYALLSDPGTMAAITTSPTVDVEVTYYE